MLFIIVYLIYKKKIKYVGRKYSYSILRPYNSRKLLKYLKTNQKQSITRTDF